MKDILDHIQSTVPRDVVLEKEIRLLAPEASDASRRNKLAREVAKGNLIRLMRGVYCLPKKYQRHGLHPFEIAQYLAFPSYVSLESALAHYHLIPEAVPTTTSVTTNRTKTVTTPIGFFSFNYLPLKLFREGFVRKKVGPHAFLIANPLKALLDYVYLHKKDYKSLDELQSDLRLNLESYRKQLQPFTNKEVLDYKNVFNRNLRVSKAIDLILWELL